MTTPEGPSDDDYWRAGIRPPGSTALPPWVPTELPPPRPRPVPELGWCARCQRVNPRPGYPEDQEGHDWVDGLDRYAYVAGVICPDCLSPEEAMAVLDDRVFGTGDVSLDGGIFINPEDAKEDYEDPDE